MGEGEKHDRILRELEKIVGKGYVSDGMEERYYYSSDPSAEPPSLPEFVVMPGSVEEVQEIVRLANRERMPITPRLGGLTLSGLAIPFGGGILMDLKRMNRILEVNEESMYAVIECGVTTGELKTYLEENHPDLWACIPHAPPSVSVVANILIHGGGQVSLRYGLNSDMVTGMEVVLPTGELLRTGVCAVANSWFSRYCLPDFTGLFIGWFGATGIVTKAGIHLWPKPKIRDVVFYRIPEVEDMVKLIMKIARSDVADDIYANSWTGTSLKRYYTPEKPEGMPEIYLDVLISGDTEDEIEFKKRVVERIVKEARGEGLEIEDYSPREDLKVAMLMIPQPLPFMDMRLGGGAEYLGCYIPIEKTAEAYWEGVKIAKKYGFQYLHLIRPFKNGHLVAIMYVFPFIQKNPEEVGRVREMLVELCRLALRLGGIPWKPSPTLQKVVLENADPSFKSFMKQIKELLDPNGIMAPEKWVV